MRPRARWQGPGQRSTFDPRALDRPQLVWRGASQRPPDDGQSAAIGSARQLNDKALLYVCAVSRRSPCTKVKSDLSFVRGRVTGFQAGLGSGSSKGSWPRMACSRPSRHETPVFHRSCSFTTCTLAKPFACAAASTGSSIFRRVTTRSSSRPGFGLKGRVWCRSRALSLCTASRMRCLHRSTSRCRTLGAGGASGSRRASCCITPMCPPAIAPGAAPCL